MKISYFIFTAWSEINYLAKKLLPCIVWPWILASYVVVPNIPPQIYLTTRERVLQYCPHYLESEKGRIRMANAMTKIRHGIRQKKIVNY